MCPNIVIAGGGFAGISALRKLHSGKHSLPPDFNLVMICPKTSFEFLPMLPDVISAWCSPESISADLDSLCKKHSCKFILGEIMDVNLSTKKIKTADQTLSYDYLIIASGTEANFYGNESAARNCYKLDTVRDAVIIRDDLLKRCAAGRTNVLVVGAGYTGIEIACNVHFLLKNKCNNFKIILIEKEKKILPSIPGWIQEAARQELGKMNIRVVTEEALSSFEAGEALLASGEKIPEAFCIWSAGVRTSDFVHKTPFDRENTRIRTDVNLRPEGTYSSNVFVAGNAASFIDRNTKKALRMAVMFSIEQGKIAARNVIKSIRDEPLSEYAPLDLGYLIPLANGKAFGTALGINVGGRPGYFLHYLMCVYRSEPEKRKLLLHDLMLKYKQEERRNP